MVDGCSQGEEITKQMEVGDEIIQHLRSCGVFNPNVSADDSLIGLVVDCDGGVAKGIIPSKGILVFSICRMLGYEGNLPMKTNLHTDDDGTTYLIVGATKSILDRRSYNENRKNGALMCVFKDKYELYGPQMIFRIGESFDLKSLTSNDFKKFCDLISDCNNEENARITRTRKRTTTRQETEDVEGLKIKQKRMDGGGGSQE